MITINIPNGLNEFKQLSEVAQVLKKAWELKLMHQKPELL